MAWLARPRARTGAPAAFPLGSHESFPAVCSMLHFSCSGGFWDPLRVRTSGRNYVVFPHMSFEESHVNSLSWKTV